MVESRNLSFWDPTATAREPSMQELGKFQKISEKSLHKRLFEFGTFVLDPQKRLLLREGQPVSLTPKAFEVLLALAESNGEVLSKEDLMRLVWPDTVVEEGNLSRNISTLRKALGESPTDHRYIVTVSGRGYRFVGELRGPWHESAQLEALENGSFALVRSVTPDLQEVNGAQNLVTATAVLTPSSARSGAGHSFFGSFAPRWSWSSAGILGAAALMLGVASLFLFKLRSKPGLNETDQILISDFTNTTGDTVFDDTLKQAITVQLAQSPYLNILADATISSTLKLMTKPPDTKLTPEVARDLCQRAGCKAYIAGTVASMGSQFVIGLNAVDCVTGNTLAQQQVTARNKEYVLKALDEAATKIRKRLGESLSTLERYDTPLEQATTPSLEALKAFTQGNLARDRKGDAETIPFFKRAIELDPQFAMAYDALGLTYSNLDEPGLASEYITKAQRLRERTSELEKFDIAANYSQIVTGELENANQISELWAQTYPRDPYPHNILGVNFEFLGQHEKALGEITEAIRLNPDGVVLYSDLMENYTALNRLDEAKATYEKALARQLDHTYLHADRYSIAFLQNDRTEMDRQLAWAAGRTGTEDLLLSLESDTRAFFGNLEKAREYSFRAFTAAQHANQKETAALWQMNSALREAEFGNLIRARKDTAAALLVATTRDVQILSALVMARTGDLQRSRDIADDLGKRFPHNTVMNRYWLPSIRAAIELNQRNPSKALEILRAVSPYDFAYPNPQVEVGRYLYPVYLRGQAYLLTGQGREAAAEFQKFPDYRTMVVNCPLASLARLGLARAYVLQDDLAQARSAYQGFFAQWKDADADISVLRQAVAEYAKLNEVK